MSEQKSEEKKDTAEDTPKEDQKKTEDKPKDVSEETKPTDETKAAEEPKASEDSKPTEEPKDTKDSKEPKEVLKEPLDSKPEGKDIGADKKKKKPLDPKKEKKKQEKDEKKKKDMEERMAKRKEELQHMATHVGGKKITDEVQMERDGYQILRQEQIASGYYSKIFKAKRKKVETEMCCKLIILDRVPSDYAKHLTTTALKIQRLVGKSGEEKAAISPQFAKVFEIFMTDTKIYIFMEQFKTLSMQTRIRTKDTITEYDAKKWGKQLVEAIDCLQIAGIAHRNIRLENLIFDSKFNIKLVGFDLCLLFWDEEKQQNITVPKEKTSAPKGKDKAKDKKGKEQKAGKELLRFDHLPPQVLNEDYDPSTVDVWSWAVFVCYCIHKQNPFDPSSTKSVEEQWNEFTTKFQLSPDSKSVLDKCFVADANARITSYDLLQHRWLAEKEKKKKQK